MFIINTIYTCEGNKKQIRKDIMKEITITTVTIGSDVHEKAKEYGAKQRRFTLRYFVEDAILEKLEREQEKEANEQA